MTAISLAPDGVAGQLTNRLFGAGQQADWPHHLAVFGQLPAAETDQFLFDELAFSGLTGRGGAGFASWKKFRSVREARQFRAGQSPIVIANAAEGEPLSLKDRSLVRHAPHLVIDGLLLAGRVLGTRSLYLAVGFDEPRLETALRVRPDTAGIELVRLPEHFLSGEASALVNYLQTGKSLPRTHVERLSRKGLNGRPTLLHNVESLAHLALIARFGSKWFRTVGSEHDPGSRLLTINDGTRPGYVIEVPGGSQLAEVLRAKGIPLESVSAALVGGFHGGWLSRSELKDAVLVGDPRHGTPAGAGVIWLLRSGQCGLSASAQILDYLAAQSAQQCGPCRFGLPGAANSFRRLVAGEAEEQQAASLQGLAKLLPGRGACHHPDGSVRFLLSSLRTFAADLQAHCRGHCLAEEGVSS